MRDLALALAACRARGDVPDDAPLGRRTPPALPGVAWSGSFRRARVRRRAPHARAAARASGSPSARYLLRHGARFDVVHTASFPYFPLLAAALARRAAGYGSWSTGTRSGHARTGGAMRASSVGTAGWLVQRRCIRVRHHAYCISRHHRAAAARGGLPRASRVLPGPLRRAGRAAPTRRVDPLVVYAGRHVQGEARCRCSSAAFARRPARRPDAAARDLGDGPTRGRGAPRPRGSASRTPWSSRAPTAGARSSDAFARAACVATASEREGYGLVVVEAAARGTPSVVVAGPRTRAASSSRTGSTARSRRRRPPSRVGAAIVKVGARGPASGPRPPDGSRTMPTAADRALARARDASYAGGNR